MTTSPSEFVTIFWRSPDRANLSTIGHLRGRLALGLRPFWSHGNHQDFTQTFVPGAQVDYIGVIGTVRRGWEQRRSRRIWGWMVLVVVLILTCIWWMRK